MSNYWNELKNLFGTLEQDIKKLSDSAGTIPGTISYAQIQMVDPLVIEMENLEEISQELADAINNLKLNIDKTSHYVNIEVPSFVSEVEKMIQMVTKLPNQYNELIAEDGPYYSMLNKFYGLVSSLQELSQDTGLPLPDLPEIKELFPIVFS